MKSWISTSDKIKKPVGKLVRPRICHKTTLKSIKPLIKARGK